VALLLAVGRSFEDAHLALDELSIRRPSLDEVFLALTGAAASPGTDGPAAERSEDAVVTS
jgi:hypothetical protein